MKYCVKLPSTKYLHECFTYDSKTGELRWKQRPYRHIPNLNWSQWNGKHAGRIAGSIFRTENLEYWLIRLSGQAYYAHRIIWKIMTGKEPPSSIDHKNGDGLNNRWKNLRRASHNEQEWNTERRKNNTSGYKGVFKQSVGSTYCARIMHKRRLLYLGNYPTAKQASAAYEAAARKLHGKFYRAAA